MHHIPHLFLTPYDFPSHFLHHHVHISLYHDHELPHPTELLMFLVINRLSMVCLTPATLLNSLIYCLPSMLESLTSCLTLDTMLNYC